MRPVWPSRLNEKNRDASLTVHQVPPTDQCFWLPGQALHVPVRTIHRFEALEDSVLLEVSTPDLTDIVRLQDDFSRTARD